MTKEQTTIYVGIDVSKDKLAVAIAGGGVRDEVSVFRSGRSAGFKGAGFRGRPAQQAGILKADRDCHCGCHDPSGRGYRHGSACRDRALLGGDGMIFPSNRVRVLVSTQPVDFRKGHDGLCALVSSTLHKDPYTGTVFVFRARRADRLKLLYWDGSGLVMAYKRLEDTTFTWPAIKDGIMALNHAQFEALFSGLDWRKVKPVDPRPPSAHYTTRA